MSFQKNNQEGLLNFVNPNTTIKEQRRFSYASMLSDTEPCYIPLSSSNEQNTSPPPPPPPMMAPYMDSLYVDVHQKNLLSAQPPLFLNLQRPVHYYDPQHKSFSPNENHLVYHPIITPVSPPLTLKEESYPEEKKSLPRSRGRRVSSIPSSGSRMFACKTDGCGKVFKRSEHLKRHVRSIHTLEKPFQCPYQNCHKRFSRSDNLNQHIRIHRHTAKETKKTTMSPKCKLPYFNGNSTNNNATPYHNSAYSNFI